MTKIATIALVCTLGLWAMPSDAGAQSLIREIADGKPWSIVTLEGRTGRLTLNPDGTGKMDGGPMSLSPTWEETRDGMCMTMPFPINNRRCVTLRREGVAVVGLRDGAQQFKLTR
ncbi:MAG: hypothetical protein WCH83_00535 [Alphaproteobacteria bacterium]